MRKKNKGSAVLEITLLIPIILGCVVLYINMVLSLVDCAKQEDAASEIRYEEDKNIANELRRWQLIADELYKGRNEEAPGD
ncbi:MAG: hypothetical protein K6G76_03400 [Lachnospiraceae bacterium]|nr:hypothetical protein [Lachnospiraceae bacterium]